MEDNNVIGSTAHSASVPASSPCGAGTLGRHLARRLVQIGVKDVFSVPGDFNLTLLDHLIAEPELNLIGCCNELNAGYAADGYARAKGVGACVVTFTVGGLSVLNAIAGAYSENLPVICVVGGPNSNDYGTNRILHHTIGLPDFSQELRCFQTVTCTQVIPIFPAYMFLLLLYFVLPAILVRSLYVILLGILLLLFVLQLCFSDDNHSDFINHVLCVMCSILE